MLKMIALQLTPTQSKFLLPQLTCSQSLLKKE